jgi:hypothetical protein
MNQPTLDFIRLHADDDVRQLALSRVPADVDMRAALCQIEGRQLAARKLPSWAACDGLLFPPRLSLEQCSSEATAHYKRQLVARHLSQEGVETTSFVDLTAGFGVDFAALAPLFTQAFYVDRNPDLCELARHNLPCLGLPQAQILSASAEEVLDALHVSSSTCQLVSSSTCQLVNSSTCQLVNSSTCQLIHSLPLSLVMLDPARRDTAGRKVALIEDCTPDVCALQQRLRSVARLTLIKLSPMLDLTAALRSLHAVVEAHVVSVGGECKELLLLMRGEELGSPSAQPSLDAIPIYCVDLPSQFASDDDAAAPFGLSRVSRVVLSRACRVVFTRAEEAAAPVPPYVDPSLFTSAEGLYLYEPSASLLKAGAFRVLSQRYPVEKVAPQSHLYVSRVPIKDFPGRAWRIQDVCTFSKRDLRRLLADTPAAELSVRGFPTSVATLRRQLHLREGGTVHLIATTLADNTRLLLKVERDIPIR